MDWWAREGRGAPVASVSGSSPWRHRARETERDKSERQRERELHSLIKVQEVSAAFRAAYAPGSSTSWHFITADERIKAAPSIARCTQTQTDTDTVQEIAVGGCDAVRTGTAVPTYETTRRNIAEYYELPTHCSELKYRAIIIIIIIGSNVTADRIPGRGTSHFVFRAKYY